MTDFGPWHHLIRKFEDDEIAKGVAAERGKGGHVTLGRTYYSAPLDDYQLVNLLGLLIRVPNMDQGDFYWEIISILGETVKKMEIDQGNNYGDQVNAEFVEMVYRGEFVDGK